MGFLLGNGIVEAYQLKYYLDNIYANDQPRWLAIEKQIFEPLTHNLSQLKAQAFDYGDWSRALNTLAGGELSSLSSALSGAAADATSPSERRMLRLAAKTAKYFTAIKDITNGIDVFLATNLGDNEYLDYLDGLAEARAVQNAIMTRSAPGVAGYVSTETPELYQYGQNPGGFTIAAGVTIENAIGGQGNDEIIGNAANNKLYGNAGDDLIDGYLGNNLIDGGDGTDTAILFGAFSDYSFSGSATSLRATNHTRGFENTLVSIEAVKIGDITYSPSVLLL
jgi:Ca2+-binding RTX toxin-like protein